MKHFALRLKDNNDFNEVEKVAKKELRSINNQINLIIKDWIKTKK